MHTASVPRVLDRRSDDARRAAHRTPPSRTRPEGPKIHDLATEIVLVSTSALVAFVVSSWLLSLPFVPSAAENTALGYLYSPAILLLAAALYRWGGRRIDGGEDPAPVTATPQNPGRALITVGLFILAAVVGSTLLSQLMSLVGAPVREQVEVTKITASGLTLTPKLLLLSITALLAAPVAEECLLRGLLFRRLLAKIGPRVAYVTTAIAFALIHGNPSGAVIYLWLAVVFARSYQKSGRLWVAILVHAGNNAVTLAYLLLAQPTP